MKVAISGHRDLSLYNLDSLHALILDSLITLEKNNPKTKEFTLLSPLAAGADILVSDIALNFSSQKWLLEVPLPYDVVKYRSRLINGLSNINSNKILENFDRLILNAKELKTLSSIKNQNIEDFSQYYENLGKYLVDNCDILITIWNGKPANGKGGTGDVVQMAKEADKPIIWINPTTLETQYIL